MFDVLESRDMPAGEAKDEQLYIVLCASGFENAPRVRSALMFSALAASAGLRTILYCIQNAVDVMVRGNIEKYEPAGSEPSIVGRLREAIEHGVEIQCCTQTMANKGIREHDLIEEAKPAGAMNLIDLTTRARGALSF